MTKRTLKPAAGTSRVSLRDATSAARVVYRNATTGRFVILDRDQSIPFRRGGKELSDREMSKKR
jgi:hypothetical protein